MMMMIMMKTTMMTIRMMNSICFCNFLTCLKPDPNPESWAVVGDSEQCNYMYPGWAPCSVAHYADPGSNLSAYLDKWK